MTIIFFLLGVALFLLTLFMGLHFYVLTFANAKPPLYEIQNFDTLHDRVKNIFEPPIREITELGFSFDGFYKIRPTVSLDGTICFGALFSDSEKKIHCQLLFIIWNITSLISSDSQNKDSKEAGFVPEFFSMTQDHHFYKTIEQKYHSNEFGSVPRTTTNFVLASSFSQLFEAHRNYISQLNADLSRANVSEKLIEIEKSEIEYFDNLVKQKIFVKGWGEDVYRVRWKILLQRMLNTYCFYLKPEIRSELNYGETQKDISRARFVNELNIYMQEAEIPKPSIHKFLFFLVTMIVTIFSFNLDTDPKIGLIIIFVLLLHEMGHAVSMLYFGFNEVNIFFVPFLGAATSGRKDEDNVRERIIIFLMGPLPGEILGAGFLMLHYFGFTSVFYTIGWSLLIINHINLLPITPLDGGRIFNFLFLKNVPFFSLSFEVICTVIILFYSIYYSKFALVFIGLILVLSIYWHYTDAKLKNIFLKKDLSKFNFSDKDELAWSIFNELWDTPIKHYKIKDKLPFVNSIRKFFTKIELEANSRILLAFSYFCGLFIPFVLYVYL